VPRVPLRIFGVKIPGLAYDVSITDPAFAAMLNMGGFALGAYGAYQALQNPAFFRGVSLISGTIASLPLRTYRNIDTDSDDDDRELAKSFLDLTPSGPGGLTPFAWKRQIVTHMVAEGECGLQHIHSQMGPLVGLWPVSPQSYTVRIEGGRRIFKVVHANGQTMDYGADCDNAIEGRCMTQILSLSLDGIHGISPVVLFQRGIQLAQAQDIAAMRTMTNGFLARALVSAKDEDIDSDDMKQIQIDIDTKLSGPDTSNKLLMVNRRLEVKELSRSLVDMQFMEGRRFSREEAALMLGLPIYMLEPSKQTSWGTGISEQNLGLQKYTFMPITSAIEEAISPVLKPSPKFCEFDYKGLLQGTPEVEIKLILEQLTAGIMSEEEARDLLGLGSKDPADTFREPTPVGPAGKVPMEPAEAKPPMQPANMNGSA
jgi:HK97 family phage portal protein